MHILFQSFPASLTRRSRTFALTRVLCTKCSQWVRWKKGAKHHISAFFSDLLYYIILLYRSFKFNLARCNVKDREQRAGNPRTDCPKMCHVYTSEPPVSHLAKFLQGPYVQNGEVYFIGIILIYYFFFTFSYRVRAVFLPDGHTSYFPHRKLTSLS